MKSIFLLAASILLFLKTNAQGFVVLELFTSEGCSSCPPAEDLLSQIQATSASQPIYALAYHVDYWDRLGWKDPFSSHAFSTRQYEYGTNIYTPQMVMNGSKECIGADAVTINNYINASLKAIPTVTIKLQGKLQGTQINLNYQTTGNIKNTRVMIAVIQKHAVSQVKRGENEGRTLSHVQIVKDLQPYKASMQLPAGFTPQDYELIAFLQNKHTNAIIAATRADIVN